MGRIPILAVSANANVFANAQCKRTLTLILVDLSVRAVAAALIVLSAILTTPAVFAVHAVRTAV